jgi:hypothetical protein
MAMFLTSIRGVMDIVLTSCHGVMVHHGSL